MGLRWVDVFASVLFVGVRWSRLLPRTMAAAPGGRCRQQAAGRGQRGRRGRESGSESRQSRQSNGAKLTRRRTPRRNRCGARCTRRCFYFEAREDVMIVDAYSDVSGVVRVLLVVGARRRSAWVVVWRLPRRGTQRRRQQAKRPTTRGQRCDQRRAGQRTAKGAPGNARPKARGQRTATQRSPEGKRDPAVERQHLLHACIYVDALLMLMMVRMGLCACQAAEGVGSCDAANAEARAPSWEARRAPAEDNGGASAARSFSLLPIPPLVSSPGSRACAPRSAAAA